MKQNNLEIRKFRFGDYVRFLKVRLSSKTRKEFSRSLLGYFIVALKDFSSKMKVYKFSVYYNNRLAGFGVIYNEKGFNEIGIFILPQYRRKGIETDVTKKLVKYCFEKLKYKKVNIIIHRNRPIMERVVKKLGFKLIKRNAKNKESTWEKKR